MMSDSVRVHLLLDCLEYLYFEIQLIEHEKRFYLKLIPTLVELFS